MIRRKNGENPLDILLTLTDPMDQLLGASITYRIAVGPNQGRKVFTLQTLPAWDDSFGNEVGKVAGFSLHAGVAAKADERQKLERLCRYVSRHSGVGKTVVADRQRPGALPAQDPVPRWHDPCHLRAAGPNRRERF